MGWTETGVKCKKHPDEIQQPGVCPSCLRDRLSQITRRRVPSSSPSPSFSSSSASYFSASTSPTRRHRRRFDHHRNGSVVMSSFSHMRSRVDELKKSRSIAAVARRNREGDAAERREKKVGFWSKLTGKMT